jgi:hypothetical protein
VRLAFHQRTKIKRTRLMPWSPYQVVCSCGFKGEAPAHQGRGYSRRAGPLEVEAR